MNIEEDTESKDYIVENRLSKDEGVINVMIIQNRESLQLEDVDIGKSTRESFRESLTNKVKHFLSSRHIQMIALGNCIGS